MLGCRLSSFLLLLLLPSLASNEERRRDEDSSYSCIKIPHRLYLTLYTHTYTSPPHIFASPPFFLPLTGGPPINLFQSPSTLCLSLLSLLHHPSSNLLLLSPKPSNSLLIHSAATSAVFPGASIAIKCPTPSNVVPRTLPSASPPLPPAPMPVRETLSRAVDLSHTKES